MKPVYSTLTQVYATAELCADRGFHIPALILTYSAMDSMGWMYAANPKARVRDRFVDWVEKYALPPVPRLRCTSLELYAARCGILHTFTGDSDLSEHGVRRFVYAWGDSNLEDLIQATKLAGEEKWVAVHVSDLTEAARLGTAQMFEDAQADAQLGARLAERGEGFYDLMSRTRWPNSCPASLQPNPALPPDERR